MIHVEIYERILVCDCVWKSRTVWKNIYGKDSEIEDRLNKEEGNR